MRIRLLAAMAAFTLAWTACAQAQTGGKPIRFIAPYTAGGVVDNTSRVVGERMARELGQPILIENRAGANGQIGTELVAKSPPDGLTLLLTSVGVAYRQHLVKLPYDPFKDLTPITLLVINPLMIVVNSKVPANTLEELVAWGKRNPDGIRYGSSGTGGPSHLAAELFRSKTGVPLTHVPYKGDSAAILDMLGGSIDMTVSSVSAAASYIKAGRLRGLAMISEKRSATLPEVPTSAEAGIPGLVADSWVGILGPANLPPDVVRRLHGAAMTTLADPATRDKLIAAGNALVGSTPEEFAAFLRNESEKWRQVIRFANIKVDE